MREDAGFILMLSTTEVQDFTLSGRMADEAKDTPFKED